MFFVAPNEVGNYRMIGSVCVSVCVCLYGWFCQFICLSVCPSPTFLGMVRLRWLVYGTIVGHRSETDPIDFGANGYIFKVKVMKI